VWVFLRLDLFFLWRSVVFIRRNVLVFFVFVMSVVVSVSGACAASLDSGATSDTVMDEYLVPVVNCQSNDSGVVALAGMICSGAGAGTAYDRAVAMFRWVDGNVSYSDYPDTRYGAVGVLKSRTGNCVDTTHLLIALMRSEGIPARYVHGYCQFSNGNWEGHVWAEVYVNGTWYTCDATSSRNSFGVIKNWNTATMILEGRGASINF
jgi:transglutaminase-like putative cysteine protease